LARSRGPGHSASGCGRSSSRATAAALAIPTQADKAGKRLPARGFIERYFQSAEDTPESLLLAVRIERALGNKNAEASYALRLRSKFPASPEAGQLHVAPATKKK